MSERDPKHPADTATPGPESTEPSDPSEPTAPTQPAEPTPPAEPTEPRPPASTASADDPLRGSRTSGIWAAVVGLGVVLVLLVVFVAQNTDTTTVRFLGWEGSFPVAVVVLIAVAGGILMTASAGTLRILQLRRRTKKGLKQR